VFIGVYEKLDRATYFLNNLKTLAEEAGGFPYIQKTQEMRANLDGFFFEIISAKDFFLQSINDKYGKLLPKDKSTNNIGELKSLLINFDTKSSDVVGKIEKLLSKKDTWLWRLNNYRNSATHRELLHISYYVKFSQAVDKVTFEKLKQANEAGKLTIKPIYKGEEKSIPQHLPRVDVPCENIKAFLLKDPEDLSQGNAGIEVIQYCEQSMKQMRGFLDIMYSRLEI
jgi:hypothetical protein